MARLEHYLPLTERTRTSLRQVRHDARVQVGVDDDVSLSYMVAGDTFVNSPKRDGLFVNLTFSPTRNLLVDARVLVYQDPSPVVTQRFNRLFLGLGPALTWYHRTKKVMLNTPGSWAEVPVEVRYQPDVPGFEVQWRTFDPFTLATGPWQNVTPRVTKPRTPRIPGLKAPTAPTAPVVAPSAIPAPIAAPRPSVAPVAAPGVHGDPRGLFKFPVLTKKSEVTLKVETIERLDAVWASHVDGERETIALVGPTGTAKTSLANNLAARHDVGIFTFDAVGAREFSDWVGTTHLRGDRTEFVPSGFLQAIDADGPYAGIHRIVLVDEVTRAESSGSLNALVPVLHDFASVYVPELGKSVSVDPAVLFILTANVGSEYSGTINLDIALSDRVTAWVRMDNLEPDPETLLIRERNPGLTQDQASRLVLCATDVRRAASRGDLPDGGGISTRRLLVAARRVSRGMGLRDAAELTWLNSYHNEAEATIVKSAIDGALRGSTTP